MSRPSRLLIPVAIATMIFSPLFSLARAEPFAERSLLTTWERTDRAVSSQEVSRTWMWGPEPFTDALAELYDEGPDGSRLVQYYDKSRMEITDPDGDASSIWHVTNGLLVNELVSGNMQLGDNRYEQYEPAEVNVVGDQGHLGVTYAVVGENLDQESHAEGDPINTYYDWFHVGPGNAGENVWTINEASSASHEFLDHEVHAAQHVPETGHTIAGPFWDFMNSSGLVYENGQYFEAPLFPNPFYATGFPITEANWTSAVVGGEEQWVLFQCFERRCLTYAPDSDPGWQVESGNVGRHYYQWRYELLDDDPESIPYPKTGDVQIVFIMEDPPVGDDGDGEYVDIQNFDNRPVDLSGWRLEDEAGNGYDFPDGVNIEIDGVIRVHLCDGEDSAGNLYWDRCAPVWNNDGDTGYLYDATGNLVHSWSY